MEIHFLAVANFDNQMSVFHFSSNNREQLNVVVKELLSAGSEISSDFSLHFLKTNDCSFESVAKMDPYFADADCYEDVGEFVALVKQNKGA